MGDTWIKRHQKAIKRYPHSSYIYDAVNLLQQYGITVERFTVEPTARILANSVIENKSRRKKQSQLNSIFINIFLVPIKLWNNYKIRQAITYLINAENILHPRDGQIEAKEKKVEAGEYVRLLLRLVLKLADLKREGILDSLFNFGLYLQEGKFHKQAITSYNKAVEIKPDYHQAWYNRGVALRQLRRSQEAIASYNKAVEIKPDYHQAWYNRAIAYAHLNNIELALQNLQTAINLNPEYQETTKTDAGFDVNRENEEFKRLVMGNGE